MKAFIWLTLSLTLHALLGFILWMGHLQETSSSHEDIVDLTLSAISISSPPPVGAKAITVEKNSSAIHSSNPINEDPPPTEDISSSTGDYAGPVSGIGDLTELPKVTKEVKATYPSEAKKAHVEGAVILDIIIDNQGMVRDVQVVSGPGHGLNESAAEALKKFEFKPGYKGLNAVAVKIRYTYRFKLDVN